jgi:hypothetical protein
VRAAVVYSSVRSSSVRLAGSAAVCGSAAVSRSSVWQCVAVRQCAAVCGIAALRQYRTTYHQLVRRRRGDAVPLEPDITLCMYHRSARRSKGGKCCTIVYYPSERCGRREGSCYLHHHVISLISSETQSRCARGGRGYCVFVWTYRTNRWKRRRGLAVASYIAIPWCPFWSPFMTRGSVQGWALSSGHYNYRVVYTFLASVIAHFCVMVVRVTNPLSSSH